MQRDWKALFSKALIVLSAFLFSSIFIYINYIATENYKAPVIKSLFLTFLFLGGFYLTDHLFRCFTGKKAMHYTVLSGLFALFFLLRFLWIHTVDTAQVSDFLRMWESAGEIAVGDYSRFHLNQYLYTYPHLAFTTLFYALIHRIGDGSLYVMKFVNILFGMVSAFFVYRIASETAGEDKLIAMVLMVLSAPFLFFSSVLDGQNPAIPFFYGGVLLYLQIFQGKRHWSYMAAVGILFGIGTLFRGVGMIFVIAVGMHLFIYGKNLSGSVKFRIRKRRVKATNALLKGIAFVTLVLSMQLCILILNGIFLAGGIFEKPTWQTEGTLLLYINAGFNHQSNGMWNQEDYDLLREVDFDYDKAQIEAKERLKERLSDKDQVMSLLSRKFRIQWGTGDFGGKYWSTLELDSLSSRANRWIVWIDYHFYFIQSLYAAMIAAILIRLLKVYPQAEDEVLFFGLILFVGFVMLYSLIEMQPRYAYIVVPMITAMAGAGIIRRERGLEKGSEISEVSETVEELKDEPAEEDPPVE